MDADARLQALESEGRRLLSVAGCALDAPVPTCPGWDNRRLVVHVGEVWDAVTACMAPGEATAATGSLLERASASLDGLLRAVSESPGSNDPLVRRVHHETSVHRVDAEIAAEDRTPVDPASALDGIDELYSVLAPVRSELPSGSLHLHQTDGDGEFMLSVVDGAVVVTREHGKGDAALRATAEDLLLVGWGRRSLDGLEFFGDAEVAAQWISLAP